MGKSGKWHGGEQPSPARGWQLWPGAKAVGQPPWKKQDWEKWDRREPKPAFPTYASRQVPGSATQPIQALAAEVRGQDEGYAILDSLQQMLNSARKAEARLAKAVAAQQHAQAQWTVWQEEMKAAWMREQKRYASDAERRQKDIDEAMEAQQRARTLVRQAWEQQQTGVPLEAAKPSQQQVEWDEMVSNWEREADFQLSGVLQRALGPATPARRTAPVMTPPGRTAMSDKVSTASGASPAQADPYQAVVPAGPCPVVSPAANAPPPGAAPPPGLEAPTPRQSPMAPRASVKESSKKGPATVPMQGPSLQEKLELARTNALRPFGGAGQRAPPANTNSELSELPAHPETGQHLSHAAIIEDDDEELDCASLSPGLGNLE